MEPNLDTKNAIYLLLFRIAELFLALLALVGIGAYVYLENPTSFAFRVFIVLSVSVLAYTIFKLLSWFAKTIKKFLFFLRTFDSLSNDIDIMNFGDSEKEVLFMFGYVAEKYGKDSIQVTNLINKHKDNKDLHLILEKLRENFK